MVQIPILSLSLDEFLMLPETEPASEYRDQPTNFYDQLETILPVPEFAQDFSLTIETLFSWLLE